MIKGASCVVPTDAMVMIVVGGGSRKKREKTDGTLFHHDRDGARRYKRQAIDRLAALEIVCRWGKKQKEKQTPRRPLR